MALHDMDECAHESEILGVELGLVFGRPQKVGHDTS